MGSEPYLDRDQPAGFGGWRRPSRLDLEGIEVLGRAPSRELELVVGGDMDDPHEPAVMARLAWGPR